MAEELAWPKKGDKAFVSVDQRASFCLSSHTPYSQLKPEAFRVGAEMILERCHEADVFRFNDELFFPVAYLYRHGLELLLKDIVYIGVRMNFFERVEVEEALTNHSLARLWTHAKKLLTDLRPSTVEGH